MARHTSRRSAREELRRIFERALSAEPGIGAEAADRAVKRLMRRAGRIAELGAELKSRPAKPPAKPATLPASIAPSTAMAKEPSDFDPYAWSAVVTLARFGRETLMERLAAIDDIEHLRKLAAAQHLGVECATSCVGELRAAILAAAERRMADRHAAAS